MKKEKRQLKIKNRPKNLSNFHFLFVLFTFYILLFTSTASAADYVLPYPSYMPGHKLYRVHLVWEKVQEYWHFGNLAKFKYHLQMADKYLVEAKTLFEYKQYLLATKALEKSNSYFRKTPLFLQKAEEEGKDVSEKKQIVKDAYEEHISILKSLLNNVPSEFEWQEERVSKETGGGQILMLHNFLNSAIEIRSETANIIGKQ